MPKRRKNGEFWESAKNASDPFTQYYNRLTELTVSVFEWENLPDTVDARFLELALMTDGLAVFFKDDVLGFLCLRCAISGELDVYGLPLGRNAIGSNGYYQELTPENSVIIFNNMIHTPSMLDIEVFSRRLADLDRAVDVNCKAQKTPVLIQCEETQRLTMKNLYSQYEGNSPVIYGDKSLNPNGIKVLKTDAPFVAPDLYELRTKIWFEALTYLGISNNSSYEKSERLIVDEVRSNESSTLAARFSKMHMRETACDQINKMFGLNVNCKFRGEQVILGSEYDLPQGGKAQLDVAGMTTSGVNGGAAYV